MWTLAVLRKDLGQVEIVKLSDKTIEKYEDDLEVNHRDWPLCFLSL